MPASQDLAHKALCIQAHISAIMAVLSQGACEDKGSDLYTIAVVDAQEMISVIDGMQRPGKDVLRLVAEMEARYPETIVRQAGQEL